MIFPKRSIQVQNLSTMYLHIKKYLISVERYHRFIFKSALGVICLVCLWVLWIVPVQFIKNRGGGGGGKSPIYR